MLMTVTSLSYIPQIIGTLRSIAITSDNQLCVTGGADKAIKIWVIKEGFCVHSFDQAHDGK
mgnify:CR=1 FL=1